MRKGKQYKDFPSPSGKVEGKSRESHHIRRKAFVSLAFPPLGNVTGRNARENREKLSIKDHHYEQGKSREIREKCVLDTFISHQFPQAGKHPMPVVVGESRPGQFASTGVLRLIG